MMVLKRIALALVLLLPLAAVAAVDEGQVTRLSAQITVDIWQQQRVSCTAWQQTNQTVTLNPDGSITRTTTYVRTCQRVNADGSVTVWSEILVVTETFPPAPQPVDTGADADELVGADSQSPITP